MNSKRRIRKIGIIAALIVIFIMANSGLVHVEAQGLVEYVLIQLRIPLDYDPPTLKPVEIGYDRISHLVANQIFESFFRITPNGSIEPAGATGYDVSPDGLVYTIQLRPEAMWSDGWPVVADHYIDGMLALGNVDPEIHNLKELLYPVQGFQGWSEGTITDPAAVGLTAIDDYTLEITLEENNAYFPYVLASPWINFAIRTDDSGGDFPTIFNGPYSLYHWVPGEGILLLLNTTHWNADNVDIWVISMPIMPDRAEQFVAYQNGELDVSGYPDEAVAEILLDPVLSTEQVTIPLAPYFIGLNPDVSPTDNLDLRIALAASIDRQQLLEDFNKPWGIRATGVIPPGMPAHQGDTVGYPFNLDLALDHLDNYIDNTPEIDEPSDIFIEIWSTTDSMIPAVADMWQENLGVTVEVIQNSWDAYMDMLDVCREDPGDPSCTYNGYRLGWLGSHNDPWAILNDMFHPDVGWDPTNWDNPTFRNLLNQAKSEHNHSLRNNLYKQAEQILVGQEAGELGDAVVIPINYIDQSLLIKSNVEYEYPGHGIAPDIMNWSIRYLVTNTNDAGPGSLRQAILDANTRFGMDKIDFDIPPSECDAISNVCTIRPQTALPEITGPTFIDGYTQPGASPNTNSFGQGSNAQMKIELDGSEAGNVPAGLYITGEYGTIQGLIINRFEGDGILLESIDATVNQIKGNFIGTDATGTTSLGNQGAGVRIIDAPSNRVGVHTPDGRNVISGNQTGVIIQATPGLNYAEGNNVVGNLIGTNAQGTSALGNTTHGVLVSEASSSVIGPNNVISGNTIYGVLLRDNANLNFVVGNLIGTDINGTNSLPNNVGVRILSSPTNPIGGNNPDQRNIISGNTFEGIYISGDGSDDNRINGNFIGTDISGTAPLPNGGQGIRIGGPSGPSSFNSIGGFGPSENLISANLMDGISLDTGSIYNVIVGNKIGTDINGQRAMGNRENGIFIFDASRNIIDSNTISFNGSDGIRVEGDLAIENTINQNSIHSNVNKGIENLGGGNLELQPPTILDILGDKIQGTAIPGSYVEIFADNNGEGRTFLGFAIADPSSGEFTYSGPLSGPKLTATATDFAGNTSEFSGADQWTPDNCEPNDSYEQACNAEVVLDLTFASPGSFESYISRPGDVDWFFFDLPEEVVPGSQITFTLSGAGGSDLPANFDLAILAELEIDPETNASPLQGVPLQGVPLQGVPLQGVPLQGVDAEGVPLQGVPLQGVDVNDIPLQGVPLQGVPLQGVPLQGVPLQGVPLQGVGFHQGRQPEELSTLFRGGMTGTYFVMVWSSTGEFSTNPGNSPYEVTVTLDEVTAEACTTAVTYPLLSDAIEAPLGDTFDPTTLILINQPRIVALYGDLRAEALLDDLVSNSVENLADHPLVDGIVVDLGSYPVVVDAYSNWDANGCDAEAANLVTLEIKKVINDLIDGHPNINNLVLVGNDLVIPMRRMPDEIVGTSDGATVPNEYDYQNELADGTKSIGTVISGNSPTFATLQLQYYLSDDFYADLAPVLLEHGHELSVPDIPIGRLVEEPEDIQTYIQAFLDQDGIMVAAETAVPSLTTGYSFLSDQALAIDTILNSKGFTPADDLISDVWLRDELIQAYTDQAAQPVVNSINAHTDHWQLAPPVYELPEHLVTTGDTDFLSADLAGTILFSVGCHMGFNFVDEEASGVSDPGALDFPQALIKHGGTLIGNWGFGYGDDAALAYSEELMTEFARQLGNSSIGHSLVQAKREYILNQAILDPVHEKVLMEAVLYGLPMWEVSLPAESVPEGVIVVATPEPPGDLTIIAYDMEIIPEQLSQVTIPDRGSYYSLAGRTQAAVFRPIQPKASIDVSGATGEVAHGVLFTGGTYHEISPFDPAITMPSWTRTNPEPQFVYEGWDPPRFWSLAQLERFDGTFDERLVVLPGQFQVDTTLTIATGNTIGRQRIYEDLEFEVIYAPDPNEFLPPIITLVNASVSSNPGVSIIVQVEDPETEYVDSSGIVEVIITYTEIEGGSTWQSMNLAKMNNSGLWGGILNVSGLIDFVVQAVDGSGNVGMFAGNGYFTPVVVNVSGPNTAVVGQMVNFTAAVSGELANANFLWDFGDGSYSDGEANAVHTFSQPGPFIVSVKVADSSGNLGEASMEITLEDTLDPSLHDTFTKLIALIQSVEQLPDGSLKNSAEDRKYSLVVKLSDIGRLIFEGDYDSAINKLTQDILKKMDGCPPEADKNDWIIECTDQTGMQEQVEGLIDAIEDLK